VGDHKLPAGTRIQYPMDGFALFRNSDRSTIRFSNISLHSLVDKVSGLSAPDKSGRRSEATKVVIDMISPLPRRFQLNIKGSAFGSNTDLPFVVRIGSASQSFSLPAMTVNVPLVFVTNGDDHKVVIEVPLPPSPGDVGDTIQLGILLSEISIVPLDAPTQGQSLSHTHSAN